MIEGPEYLTTAGEILTLTWTRLKRPEEVEAAIPEPPVRLPIGVPAGRPGTVVMSGETGEGFDRQGVEMRRWSPSDDPGKVLRDQGHKLWPPAPPIEATAVEIDRQWEAEDAPVLAIAAMGILEGHAYPVEVSWPRVVLWSWIGDDLCWAEAPPAAGRLSNYAGPLAYEPWAAFRTSERFNAIWPRWGPLQWAEAVHRQLGREAGATAQPAWADGFTLGAYLAEERLRRRFAVNLIRGERNARATQAGADLTNRRQQQARARNVRHAVELARVRLKSPPGDGRRWTLGLLAEEVSFAWQLDGRRPMQSTIKDYLRKAISAGDLPNLATVS